MTFIMILVALIVERFFNWNHIRNWQWFSYYQRFLNKYISAWPKDLVLVFYIVPPLLLVALINTALTDLLYDVLKIIFGIIVLMYCLGPRNLWVEVYAIINDLHKEDPKSAVERAQASFNIAPTHSQDFHKNFTNAIFVAANQRIFAVLFWFAILGPVGAVLYRLIQLCAAQSPRALQVQAFLDWIPARIFALTFALGGHFRDVITYWKKDAKYGLHTNEILLAECGMAALDVAHGDQVPEDGSAEKEALALLDRTFVIWLAFLAIVVLLLLKE